MSVARVALRRALLYGNTLSVPSKLSPSDLQSHTVPGSSQKMLDKSRDLTVDCVAYDLEDSVTPAKKPEARKAIKEFLNQPRAKGIRENSVRINAVGSGLALDDLSVVVSSTFLDLQGLQI